MMNYTHCQPIKAQGQSQQPVQYIWHSVENVLKQLHHTPVLLSLGLLPCFMHLLITNYTKKQTRHYYNKWLASQTALNQRYTSSLDCYDLKFKEVDTDHPHLVNFPWRAVPHGREDEPPHGPLRLRPPGPPWDPHGLGAHLLGHEPLLHAHVQPTQNIQHVLTQI